MISGFITYMKQSRYSKDTLDTYTSMLRNFEIWLKTKKKSMDNFTQNDVREYMMRYYSPSSANTFLATVKSYLRYRVGSLPMGDPNIIAETQRESAVRLIRAEKKPSKIQKKALTVEELGALIKKMKDNGASETALSGAMVTFYFGARPRELAIFLKKAKINWKDRTMIIRTAKRGESERYLVWHPKITPFLEHWYKSIDTIPYPEEWVTKRLNRYNIAGLRVTSRVARKTFQTNMRGKGIDDFYIDFILGHVSHSPIADVYTDYSDPRFKEKIREIMCDKHYMIVGGVI